MARTDHKVPLSKSASSVAAAALWMVFTILVMMSDVGNAERVLKDKQPAENFVEEHMEKGIFVRVIQFLWQGGKSSYQHVWPVSIYSYLLHHPNCVLNGYVSAPWKIIISSFFLLRMHLTYALHKTYNYNIHLISI